MSRRLEGQLLALVKFQNLASEQIIVAGLHLFGKCFHPGGTHFVVLGGGGFSVCIFLAHQFEGGFGRLASGLAALVLAFGSTGIIVGLLNFLVQGFLAFFQLPSQCVTLDTGTLYTVAGREAIEQGDAERKLQVLVHVLMPLATEGGILYPRDAVIVGSYPGTERELRIPGTLGDADALGGTFQTVLGGLDGGLVQQSLGIDFVRQGELGAEGFYIRRLNLEVLGCGKLQEL